MALTLYKPTFGECVECSRENKVVRYCEDSAPSIYLCSSCWICRYEDPYFVHKKWVRRILQEWALGVIFFIIFEGGSSDGTTFTKNRWS